jgi:hypothetical protein
MVQVKPGRHLFQRDEPGGGKNAGSLMGRATQPENIESIAIS